MADLDEADVIADQLVSALGARAEKNTAVQGAAVQRQRNFTLLANVYDEVRRAITFLRWKEDDVDRIAPSLYAGRGNSNIRKKELPIPAEPSVLNPTPATPPAEAEEPSASPFVG